jgi:hypothetical protein
MQAYKHTKKEKTTFRFLLILRQLKTENIPANALNATINIRKRTKKQATTNPQ